jgi:hypothetical protein
VLARRRWNLKWNVNRRRFEATTSVLERLAQKLV